jgi:hypothetical protein
MHWNNGIGSNYREERPTAPIYAMRKEERLEEAHQIALRLYKQDSADDDIKKAFSWVLIDLCKKYVSEEKLNQAQIYFKQLTLFQFDYEDEFVDTIQKQIRFLKPKFDKNYAEIQHAEELSKNGKNQEALTIFKNLISQNRLTELHHESYGWIIYRYIKAEESTLSSVEVRTFLRDYMDLRNERPSMLHSMILNFALNYSKTHSDFKFYNFFLLWNSDNLRYDDLHDGYKDGKSIPSLISRICREFVNTNTLFDIEEILLSKIDLSKEAVLDFFREAFFWNVFNTHKENKFSELWNLFEQYNINYSKYEQSKWHSEILSLAERYMQETDEWRFLEFFKNWNPVNLLDEDWKEVKKDGKIYNSLAAKCYIKYFNLELNKNRFNEAFEFIENIISHSKKNQIIELLRESFFWQLFNLHKNNKQSELWKAFNKYNQTFSKYEMSKWHSEVLSLAERFMQENEEWRFLEFFKNWNPVNLLNEDWKEVKKDEKNYKPLAIKCLKKAFEIIKTQNKDFTESWLLPFYSKSVKIFPDDEWLLRENALLLIKNNELELAINIYRKLVLELGDKSYIWNEFSSCFTTEFDLKIGMLAKAIQLEKNEDFLGDIHIELAKTFLDNGLAEHSIVELNSYKSHRELKGWKLSELYNELSAKTKNQNTDLKDNKSIYDKYIPFAEQYAYSDIDWTEVILIDKWKNDEGKERIAFTNGKTVDFSIGSRRFGLLKQSSLGSVYKFKLHKQITENKYIPLIVEKSEKLNWSILDDIYATIDYINTEKNIIHAISSDNKEVFFPKGIIQLQIGDFIWAKYFTKKVKDEIRVELKNIKKIDKAVGVIKFPKIIAVIDGVNQEKNLFHYVGNSSIQGIVKFTETNIIAEEGKFLEIFYASKKDKKHNKTIFKAIEIRETEETNPKLIKSIKGNLELKYKIGGRTIDYYDLDESEMDFEEELFDDANKENELEVATESTTEDEIIITDNMFDENGKLLIDKVYSEFYDVQKQIDEWNNNKKGVEESVKRGNIKSRIPDFGFVDDFYVPKKLLIENNLTCNCNITATAVFSGDKWKIIKLEKV